MRDNEKIMVNFENTVIIMTTNAGSDTSSSISGFAEKKEERTKDKTERALSTFLRPEFINRVDEIITFRHLDKDDFVKISALMVGQLKDHLMEQGIKLICSDDAIKHIAEKSYSEKFGARNMRRYIEKNLEDKLASLIIDSYDRKPAGISVDVRDCEIVIISI